MLEDHTINQKYIDYIQPFNQDIFALVHTRMRDIDPHWWRKNILDYGCNNALLLKTARGVIDYKKYLGVDVQGNALDIARNTYSGANFLHYDGYHVAFNPTGQRVYPDIGQFAPEIILCHGVFTHCDMRTILDTIDYFRTIIAPGGYIIFSLWEDRHLPQYINIFLKQQLNIVAPSHLLEIDYSNSYYLINRCSAVVDQESLDMQQCDWLETFYRRDYLMAKIPNLLAPKGLLSKHTIFVLPV